MQNPKKKITNIPIIVLTFLILISFFVIVVFPSYDQYHIDNDNRMKDSISFVQSLRGNPNILIKIFIVSFKRAFLTGKNELNMKKNKETFTIRHKINLIFKRKFGKNFLPRRKRCNCLFSGHRNLPVLSKHQKKTQYLRHARNISFKNA